MRLFCSIQSLQVHRKRERVKHMINLMELLPLTFAAAGALPPPAAPSPPPFAHS